MLVEEVENEFTLRGEYSHFYTSRSDSSTATYTTSNKSRAQMSLVPRALCHTVITAYIAELASCEGWLVCVMVEKSPRL